jgi:hypothetical protein
LSAAWLLLETLKALSDEVSGRLPSAGYPIRTYSSDCIVVVRLTHCVVHQRTVVLLAYRERDPLEAGWFERAAIDFDIRLETIDANWKQHVTFEVIDAPSSQEQASSTHKSSASSASSSRSNVAVSSSVQTAAVRFQHDARPLLIYRMQRRARTPVNLV